MCTLSDRRALPGAFAAALAACVVSLLLSALVMLSTFRYGSPFDLNIAITAGVALCMWLAVFIMQCVKTRVRFVPLFATLLLSVLLAVYLACCVWGESFLSLDLLQRLANGSLHVDTLYHAELAQSVSQYGFPAILFNGVVPTNYHFGSHLLLGLVSSVCGVNILYTYFYLYPVLFLPLYVYLLIRVAARLKPLLADAEDALYPLDMIAVLCFFIGVLPPQFMENIGIWQFAFVGSESFVLSLILALSYLALLLSARSRGWFTKRPFALVWLLLANPAFMLATLLAKVSTGVLLVGCIAYYFLRTQWKKPRYWLLNGYYCAVALLYLMLMQRLSQAASGLSIFEWTPFAYVRLYTADPLRYGLIHYLYLFSFTGVVLWRRFHSRERLSVQLADQRHIADELLAAVFVAANLPGLVANVGAVSVAYFSQLALFSGVLALIGTDTAKSVSAYCQSTGTIRRWLMRIAAACLLFTLVVNARPARLFDAVMQPRMTESVGFDGAFKQRLSDNVRSGRLGAAAVELVSACTARSQYADAPLVQNLEAIDALPRAVKQSSCIYADETADVFDRCSAGTFFLLSSYTGVPVENLIYTEGEGMFYRDGTPVQTQGMYWFGDGSGYRIDAKMTLDEVLSQARQDGKAYVIHLFNGSFEVLPTGVE